MQEIYDLIEQKIKEAGYAKEVDGFDIYNEICDEIEDKEPGSYIFMSKKTDTMFFEYLVQVFEEEFNLSSIKIHDGDLIYDVDFDQ